MQKEHDFTWGEPVLSETEVKRSHYVPRTYLQNFSDQSGQIRVVDFNENKEYRTSPQNIAVESHFYDIDIDIDGKVVSSEDWLANLENQAAPLLGKLITNPSSIGSLDDAAEVTLARFVAAFRFRTPAFREWYDAFSHSQVSQIKELVQSQLIHLHGAETGKTIFQEWDTNPDSWWLQQEKPLQPAASSTHMLQETQGFSNLIRAAPWRIGSALGSRLFYTSDNPVSAYLRPVRPWWEVGAFASFEYYLPLSPEVLLKIERRPEGEDNSWGQRRHRDFSLWEVSMARHIISRDATRFVYGDGIVVPKQCASGCLKAVAQASRQIAGELTSSAIKK